MRIFYIFFIFFTILSFNCSSSSKKVVINPLEENKPKPEKVNENPKEPSKNCNDKNCIIPKNIEPNIQKNNLDERYYYGNGWDIILPENWVISPDEKSQLNSTFEKGTIFITGSITVVDYNKNCLWTFSKERTEALTNKPGIKILDNIIVDIGGAKHVVLLFIHKDNIIGLQALTAFNKKGYITTCLGNFQSEEDITFILDRCSDFSNGINFSIVRRKIHL